jgi:hypothetical protein
MEGLLFIKHHGSFISMGMQVKTPKKATAKDLASH